MAELDVEIDGATVLMTAHMRNVASRDYITKNTTRDAASAIANVGAVLDAVPMAQVFPMSAL